MLKCYFHRNSCKQSGIWTRIWASAAIKFSFKIAILEQQSTKHQIPTSKICTQHYVIPTWILFNVRSIQFWQGLFGGGGCKHTLPQFKQDHDVIDISIDTKFQKCFSFSIICPAASFQAILQEFCLTWEFLWMVCCKIV